MEKRLAVVFRKTIIVAPTFYVITLNFYQKEFDFYLACFICFIINV